MTSDWTPAGLPGAADTAVISASGTAYTVTINSAEAVRAVIINSASASVVANSTLTLGGAMTVTAGSFTLASGVVNGGTISVGAGGSFVGAGGTLSGVAAQGTLSLQSNNTSFTLTKSTTFAGTGGTGAGIINFAGGSYQTSYLDVLGSNTLANVTLNIGNGGGYGYNYLYNQDTGSGNAVLTLAANFIINQTNQDAAIGSSDAAGDAIINNGTINAHFGGGFFLIDATHFTNAGVISVSGGDTVALTGTISAALINGIVVASNGYIGIGGVVNGGTITSATGGVGSYGGSGTLSGVAVQGTLNLANSNNVFTLTRGVTFAGAGGIGAGTINFTGGNYQNSYLYVLGGNTLANATLNIGSGNGYGGFDYLYNQDSGSGNAVLTLASTFTINQTNTDAAISGGNTTGDAVTNNGTINAGYSGGLFTINPLNFTNNGLLSVSNGDTITLSTNFTNLSGATLTGGSISVGAGGVLQLNNNQTIGTLKANLTLSGANSVIQSLNTTTNTQTAIESTIGTIASTGTLSLLAGRGLATTNALSDQGRLVLNGGTITAASLSVTNAGSLVGYGTIAAALVDNTTVTAQGGTLTVAGAVTGAGTLQIAAASTLAVLGSVGAQDTVAFNGNTAILQLTAPASFAGFIANLAPSDEINLGTVVASSAVISGSTLTVGVSGGTPLTFHLSGTYANERVGVSPDGHTLTAYRYAQGTHAPEPVALGNRHVGDTVTGAVTVTNTATADGYSEKLDASIGTVSAGITATGTVSLLRAGASDATDVKVGLVTTTAGVIAGTATVNESTDGSGTDGGAPLSIGTDTINVTGTVYAYAAPVLSSNTISLGAGRIGGPSLAGSVTLADGTGGAYQESLIYQFGTALPAGIAISNGSGTLASGQSTTLTVTQSGTTAGSFSGLAIGAGTSGASFVSTGVGTSGLANTTLAAPALSVSGQVYAPATAVLSASTVNFGVVHVGQVVNAATLTVTNGATGALTDVLTAGTVSKTGSYTGTVAEVLGTGLASSASGAVTFGLATTANGVQSGTVNLGFVTHDSALADLALAAVPVTVTGTVDNYAVAAIKVLSGGTITGTGTAEVLNLGTLAQNSGTTAVTLNVQNGAAGIADLLAGSFVVNGASLFTNSGFAAFSGLAAGQASATDTIALSTATAGTFSETITLNATGSNSSYSGTLAPQTLTITGVITPTYTLTAAPTTIVATTGNDVFIATGGALNGRDNITGGPGGTNSLKLSGGGIFDLTAPRTLANIQTVNASEGQLATDGSTGASQIVFLRDGMNVTVNVASGTIAAGNPNPASITIYGGTDSSTIKLGSDSDTVVLGSATETVTGGGGTALVQATSAFAGALVTGTATGLTTLEITGGGTATLNANTTYATIQVDQATNLTLSKLGFISAVGQVAGNSITAVATNQTLGGLAGGDTLTGYSGFGDTFLGLAAGLNGDTIAGFGGTGTLADKIDVTNLLPTATLGYTGSTTQGVLTLNDGTHSLSVTMLGNFTQSRFSIATDSHSGSIIKYT